MSSLSRRPTPTLRSAVVIPSQRGCNDVVACHCHGYCAYGSRRSAKKVIPNAQLSTRSADVWYACLDVPGAIVLLTEKLLSEEEQHRAKRYRFERDWRRFVVARGTLREILSHYVGQSPGRVPIAVSEHGKPILQETSDVDFNLSHTGDLAVYAVTRGRRIGIDIESVRVVPETLVLAERLCSSLEQQSFLTLAEPDRSRAFLISWVRREAYAKARGLGLSLDMNSFSMSAFPDPPMLVTSDESPAQQARWTFADLPLGPSYAGCLALHGAMETPVLRKWVR